MQQDRHQLTQCGCDCISHRPYSIDVTTKFLCVIMVDVAVLFVRWKKWIIGRHVREAHELVKK